MDFTQFAKTLQTNIAQVIVGKAEATELLLVTLLVEGHVLIEDVPGIGKTTLAKALARSLDGSFARIQFTPDLLPCDVTGMSIFNQKAQAFEFHPGPIFSQVLLADEINRATRAPSRRCWRRCRNASAPSTGRPIRCRSRFWCWRRRTRSSWKAPFRCPRRSSTAS